MITMKSVYFTLIGLLAASLSFSTFALSKQEMGTVINLAGKQRMLTQKMSKEILLIAKGIDADANKANLQKTAALFDKTLKGLVNGDADLGLPKTDDPAILEQLATVSKLWDGFKQNVDAVLAGNVGKDVLAGVAAQNLPLLKEMNKAVQMYAKMSGSDLDPAMATTINLAGKQRMLTQKMTKELLLIANGIDVDANKANLQKTAALFERTLKGLFDEDKELGLPGTKDPAIRAQLEVVQKLWAEYKPVLDKVDTTPEGLAQAAKLNLPLLKEMNKAVKMYEKSVK
ncbi:MAG TPA: hypothetical protein EYH03_05600 [Chromatiales bacterium]|nr:hypothetical protein [Chromatiales bacterium]